MTITQVYLNKDNFWDTFSKDGENLYLVRFSEPKARKEDGRKKEMPPLPYGLSFKSLSKMNIGELMTSLNSQDIAIVKIEK